MNRELNLNISDDMLPPPINPVLPHSYDNMEMSQQTRMRFAEGLNEMIEFEKEIKKATENQNYDEDHL